MSRTEVSTTIASVTVYENRAQVHRTATVLLHAGKRTVVFDDIPASVDRDSVQVSLRPLGDGAKPGSLALNGITFEQREREAPSDEVKAAQKSHDELYDEKAEAVKRRLSELDLEGQQANDEAEMLGTFWDNAVQRRAGEPAETFTDMERWQTLLEAKIGNDAAALERQRDIAKRRKELQDELAAIAKERQKTRPTGQPKPKTNALMLVHLEAKEDIGKLELLISYMMSNASWRAAYDLRVDTTNGTASLTYHALVQQRTSESWDNVNLTMSTAKPSVSGRAPDLTPWRASVYAPVVFRKAKKASGFRSRAKSMNRYEEQEQLRADALDDFEESEDDADEAELEEAAVASFDSAEVEAGGTAVSFDVPHQHTVPPTNDPVRMSLTVITLTPEITYATRPSMAELAYAILNASNTSNFTIMPGEANVFVNGQFITRTTLSRIAPKNTLRVGIGQESSIAVKYKLIKEENSESGGMLSAKKKQREYYRQVVLKNNKDAAASIRVEHELPTAEDSRIEAHLVEPAPSKELETKDGKLTLTVSLKPREERKIPIRISVTYPSDLDMEGL